MKLLTYHEVPFSSLVGKTITNILVNEPADEIIIVTSDGAFYRMHHEQSCCEDVHLNDIIGMPINDLIGSPILLAEVRTNKDNPKSLDDESFTWTFYELANINGALTLRWYGTSNGYYSEEVTFECAQQGAIT